MANEWKYAKAIKSGAAAWQTISPPEQDSVWICYGGPLLDRFEDGIAEFATESGLSIADAAGLLVAVFFDRIDNEANCVSRGGCTLATTTPSLTEADPDEETATYVCCFCEHEQHGGNNCEKCGSDKLEHVEA